MFYLGPIKLLLPYIVFLLQLAKYIYVKRSVLSNLPALLYSFAAHVQPSCLPVQLCSTKPNIVSVFAEVITLQTQTPSIAAKVT